MKILKRICIGLSIFVLIVLILQSVPGVRFVTAFLTPILFYGKVVDEKGEPVPSANVSISFASNPGPGEGHAKEQLETDSQGRFWAFGHGLGIMVQASKAGYYTLDKSGGSFCYSSDAGKLDRHISSADPALFTLRKIGDCERLVTYRLGGKIDKRGEPISFDLHSGRTFKIAVPDVTIQSWVDGEPKPGTYKHFDWHFLINVPDGGIQPSTGGDFDFIAPETGYGANEQISEQGSDLKWKGSFQQDYFLKLRTGEYVRMHLEYGAGGYNTYSMTYYLNPQLGHRNLESGTQ